MIDFDKQEIKDCLSIENIFELLQDWGGEPEYSILGIISRTICHNHYQDEASRKLYYYDNTQLFRCYTGCEEPTFDIFQLTIKVMLIQHHLIFDLNDAVRWIATRFGFVGKEVNANQIGTNELDDWNILANYRRIQENQPEPQQVLLKEYDRIILNRFDYNILLRPWLTEGISQKVLNQAKIGYYPGGNQITIPHFDINSRFIGLRGRTLSSEDEENFGKYRPIKVNGIIYSHPLGLNLYNLEHSKMPINKIGKAIIFEAEKSTLKMRSLFGANSDISVACCGSSISNYQMQLLLNCGVKEIIIAFDRQFQRIGDNEFNHLKKKFLSLYNKWKNYVLISFILDTKMITSYKASPIDEGPQKFQYLFKNRIIL